MKLPFCAGGERSMSIWEGIGIVATGAACLLQQKSNTLQQAAGSFLDSFSLWYSFVRLGDPGADSKRSLLLHMTRSE